MFATASEGGTDKTVGDHLGAVPGEELGDAGNTVANDVVQQLAGQLSHPMLLVRQQRPRVAPLPQFVAVVAFHVDGGAAEVTPRHQLAKSPRRMAELGVMAGGNLEALLLGQTD